MSNWANSCCPVLIPWPRTLGTRLKCLNWHQWGEQQTRQSNCWRFCRSIGSLVFERWVMPRRIWHEFVGAGLVCWVDGESLWPGALCHKSVCVWNRLKSSGSCPVQRPPWLGLTAFYRMTRWRKGDDSATSAVTFTASCSEYEVTCVKAVVLFSVSVHAAVTYMRYLISRLVLMSCSPVSITLQLRSGSWQHRWLELGTFWLRCFCCCGVGLFLGHPGQIAGWRERLLEILFFSFK